MFLLCHYVVLFTLVTLNIDIRCVCIYMYLITSLCRWCEPNLLNVVGLFIVEPGNQAGQVNRAKVFACLYVKFQSSYWNKIMYAIGLLIQHQENI